MSEETQPKMEIREIPIEQIKPNPWNPNQMDEHTFDRLTQEIQEVGYIDPIQVVEMDDGTYRIIGGEHRWTAGKVLGWKKIQAVVLSDAKWKDEDLQKFVTVRLNVLHGKTNPDKFIKLYEEMASRYGEEALQGLFAYTDQDAWGKLKKEIGKGIKGSLSPELAKKFDEVIDEVKTVEGLSAVLNHLFTKYGNTLDHSYMVFTYGGKEHCYVVMDKETKRAVDGILSHCQEQSVDINTVIAPALKQAGAALRD
jgi:uncharacterized ParB-like nuclease family protein